MKIHGRLGRLKHDPQIIKYSIRTEIRPVTRSVGGVIDIARSRLSDLMCEDNCIFLTEPDAQNRGDVFTLQDNGHSCNNSVMTGGNASRPYKLANSIWRVPHLAGSIPVTITEQGANSGVFTTYDRAKLSALKITDKISRGSSAVVDYNETSYSILASFDFATIDIQPVDSEWNSGETISVMLNDGDANKNSRADEDLDLFNPKVDLIPSIKIGNPFTLKNLASVNFNSVSLDVLEVQQFSQRALLKVPDFELSVNEDSTLAFILDDTYLDLFQTINDPSASFFGFNFFNVDIRSFFFSAEGGTMTSVDVEFSDGEKTATWVASQAQNLLNLADASGHDIFTFNPNANVQIRLIFHIQGTPKIASGSVLPVVCDFFSFGIRNDGTETTDRISHMIARMELEETGDNTSTFAGSVEYRSLNQLNVLNPATYQDLSPIADNLLIIIAKEMVRENSVRINYLDLGADGVSITISDEEEAPSHSGIVSFNKDTYRPGETVIVTLEDPDLNLDSDLIDIYSTVSPFRFPNDPARDTAGRPGLGAFGRLLDITIDDHRWMSGLSENGGSCGEPGFPHDGLAATGFSLVEVRADRGVFVGSFQFPETYCNPITGNIESTFNTDIEVNYSDFSDASGSSVEVGDSADNRANTGSVTLDRTVYPVPFGSVNDFFPEETQTDASTPNGDSLFPVHLTGITADGDQNIDATTEEIAPGDVILHIRITDPDLNQSQSKGNGIAEGDHGPVTVSVIRGNETVVLATAGGSTPNSGVITSGRDFIPGLTRELGPIREIEPDTGIFEFDLPLRYTDGPESANCPTTPESGYSTLSGDSGVLGRFDRIPGYGDDYCILQGDIIQVSYQDSQDAGGDPTRVTDSGTFDLRNGVLQSDKSVYIMGRDLILTLIEPDFDLDSHRRESYILDLIEWNSDAAMVTFGELGGESGVFDSENAAFRETGDNTGIFQARIKIPQKLQGNYLARGEEVRLQYMDWGPTGADSVGQEREILNLSIFLSNFGATVDMDQSEYSWTDKVYITVVAPDWNRNPGIVDTIGNKDLNPIRIATRGFRLDNYSLVETGMDTSVFTGEVILTGFLHDADGDPLMGGESGFDTSPRTTPLTGGGPINGFIQSSHDDEITVTFEFSPGEQVEGRALIRWHPGEIQWLESHYPPDRTGTVRVIDRDMNLNPELVDSFTLHVSSATDPAGIRVRLRETNEATGIFEGDVRFSNTDESGGATLRVTLGDQVMARYEDHTPPDPHQPSEHLEVIATARIGSGLVDPTPLEALNPRVEDSLGNPLNQVSVNQQVLISIDVANFREREQAFTYFVQIRDEQTLVEFVGWITGSISPNQSFSPGLFWTPTSPGQFEATLFFWEDIDNPIPLTKPKTISIQVN